MAQVYPQVSETLPVPIREMWEMLTAFLIVWLDSYMVTELKLRYGSGAVEGLKVGIESCKQRDVLLRVDSTYHRELL